MKELTTVVGIGASAGGLEALERFFSSVRPHGNVAYVVVQHLSPEFKSMMGEILSRLTDLDIKPVSDQLAIEPDTIYLNIPRSILELKDGRFQLELQNSSSKENLLRPIDTFFTSLGKEYRENAVGVVLSGTGTDGNQGVPQIVAHNGLILTQDLNSSLFGSMPQAAKESAQQSMELTPEEMPELIQDYIRDPESISPLLNSITDMGILSEETALSFMLSLLQRKFQTDFSQYKPQTILRRLERRMTLDDVENLVDYARKAQKDEELLDQIYRELLIDVTRFFRDPEAFTWLETQLIPELVQSKEDGESLRIWIAACSSGEEAYSLAILFLEEIERQNRSIDLRVFATDIHQSSISFASNGQYSLNAIDQIPYHIGKKYFDTHSDCIKVKKQLRQKVVFSSHDLLGDPYFGQQDLITCRNMLIYIRPDSQAQILKNFTTALKPNGYLFLGPSEHLTTQILQYYETLSRHWRVFQKTSSPAVGRSTPPRNRNIHLPQHLQENQPEAPANMHQGWEPALLKALIPAGFVCNNVGELKEIYGRGKEYLNFSIGKVSLNLTELLADSLAIGLRNSLLQAQRKKEEVVVSNIQVTVADEIRIINLRTIPFEQDSINRSAEEADQFYLVILEEARNLGQLSPIDPNEISTQEFNEIHSLKLELAFTRESLQASLEEIETSNEELQSSNEELTAANEELQSTNEELSSVNEELYTVNAEYQEQNRVLNQLFNDKHNLERASGVLTIFLDGHLCIREMTPACLSVFELIDADIGRPINQFPTVIGLEPATLKHLVELALEGEQSAVETLTHKQVPMLMSIIPYYGDRGELTGVILNFVDLTVIRRLEKENREMHNIADQIPIIMTHIGADLRYRYVNQHFLSLFEKDRTSVIGQHPKDIIGEANYLILKPHYDQVLAGDPVEFINSNFLGQEGRFAKNNFFPSWNGDKVDGFYVFATEVTEFEQDRQKALNNLLVSEERYKSIVENNPDLIDRYRPDDYLITYANQASLDDHPTTRVGQSLLDYFDTEEEKDEFKQHVAHIVETGEPRQFETKKKLDNGTEQTIIWREIPIFDQDGNVIEIQAVGRDVSELLSLINKLALSEERYRGVVDAQSELINRWRPDDFIITFTNATYKQYYSIKSLQEGDNILDGLDPAYLDQFRSNLAKLLESGEPQSIEEKIVAPDGSVQVIVWTDTPIFNSNGTIVEVQGVGRDVTEIRQAQDQLVKSETLYRSMVNHLPDLVYRFKADDLEITFLNNPSRQYFPTMQTGTPMLDYYDDNKARIKKFKSHVAKILKTNETQSFESTMTRPDGSIRIIEWKDSPIHNKMGEIEEIQGAGRDVTVEREALHKVKVASEQINELFNSLPAWVAIIDRNYKFEYLNNYYQQNFGVDVDASIGLHMSGLSGPEVFANEQAHYDKALAGDPVQYFSSIENSEMEFHADLRLIPRRVDGEVTGFYLMGFNITELQKTRKELVSTLEKFEAINNNLPAWISIIDKNHKFLYLNDYYRQTMGLDIHQNLGRHVKDVLGAKIYEVGRPHYDKALNGEPVSYLNFSNQDGEEKVGLITLIPNSNQAEVDFFYVLGIDLSEQLHYQKSLDNAIAQLEAVNNKLPIWISIVDQNYRYMYVNDFYMESIGRKREEFVGMHIQDAISKDFFERGKPQYDRVLAGERIDYLNKGIIDGEEADLVVSLVPRKNEADQVDSFFVLTVKKIF